jgi:hypothetical protein
MSLLGATTAVVSLGASCQTARQIRLHGQLLAQAMGEALEPRSFPLDWMFAPPDAVARLLRSDIRVPPHAGELMQAQRPFWPRHGVWLWHDAPEEFGAMQERMQRRWDRFLALRALQRRVLVLSNTQNNLARVPDIAPQRLDFRLTAQRMRAVTEAAQALLGTAGTEVVFVAYAARISDDARGCGLPLAILEPDATDHEGDAAQWGAALARLVRPG